MEVGCTAVTWKTLTYSIYRWDHSDGLVTSAIYFVFYETLLFTDGRQHSSVILDLPILFSK